MASRKFPFFDQLLDHGFELQQAQRVGDRSAILTRPLSYVFLSEIELVGEALKGPGLFHRVQILALEVFDKRHLEREFLGNLADDHRNARQRGPLRGAPTALAGNQLVAKTDPPDDERLDDPARTDRAR